MPRVHEAPAPDVAVVGGLELDAALGLAHGARDVVGMAQRRGADLPLQAGIAHQLGGGLLAEAERVVVRRGARNRAPARLDLAGQAAVDEDQLAARAQLERTRQPAQAAPASSIGGGGPASTSTTVAARSSRTYPQRSGTAGSAGRPSS